MKRSGMTSVAMTAAAPTSLPMLPLRPMSQSRQ